jgi:hypothetical protein
LNVLHDRSQRHLQRPAKIADRGRAIGKTLEHAPPAGVGHGMEDAVQHV